MEAFKDNKFVCLAISPIVFNICSIPAEDVLISAIASTNFFISSLLVSIFSPTCFTAKLIFCASSAFAFTSSDKLSIDTASSSIAFSCSNAPFDNICAPVDTLTEPEATSSAETVI